MSREHGEHKIIFVGQSDGHLASIRRSIGAFGEIFAYDPHAGELMGLIDEKIDLVIIEMSQPVQKALKLCSAFRKTSKKVPIVVLASTHGEVPTELLVDFLFRGADDFIQWPIERAGFAARARSLIRRASW